MKNNKSVVLGLILSIVLMSVLIGFSFAYFTVSSNNKNNQKISIENGTMELTYTDCINKSDCSNISAELEPGDSISKTFSVKNTGTLDTSFKIVFSKSSNTFLDNELVYSLYDNDNNTEISNGTVPYGDKTNSYVYTDTIKSGEVKNYKLTINFKNIESGNNESNKEGTFNINLGIDANNIWNFDYTGDVQEFVVPKNGEYSIELWGASGGSYDSTYHGGDGGYTKGNIKLTKDTKFYVYVGGDNYCILSNKPVLMTSGGYNGGLNIYVDKTYDEYFCGGGGATDIRLNKLTNNDSKTLISRIMVAAGGGGGSFGSTNYWSIGGSGGGLVGYGGHGYFIEYETPSISSKGATQTTDSLKFISKTTDVNGSGGGYFLVYSSSWRGGAGGSSYISGHNGCVALSESSTDDSPVQRADSKGIACTDGTTDITCSYHYSGYIFTDTVMIDGAGYNWTTEKGEYVGQPQPDGSVTKGHSGNGYARITYLSNN